MKNTTHKLILLVTLAAVAFGCRGEREIASPVIETREVRDDLGRIVNVPLEINRAISLAPSLTEMIFAIGAGDKLVGVTTYCNYPAETAAIEKVGDTQTPNIEKIIALRPQVVFVSTDSQLEAFMQTLAEQGIAVYVTNPKTLEDVFANMRRLGDLFGDSQRAENVVNSLSERATSVSHVERDLEKRRLFIQISNEPLFTVGRDSFLTALVEQAGGLSVTKDVPSGYPKLSKETAAALDPDVILLSDSEDNREPNVALRDSKAVKNGRVFHINADIISRPGPRLVDALEEIAAKLKESE